MIITQETILAADIQTRFSAVTTDKVTCFWHPMAMSTKLVEVESAHLWNNVKLNCVSCSITAITWGRGRVTVQRHRRTYWCIWTQNHLWWNLSERIQWEESRSRAVPSTASMILSLRNQLWQKTVLRVGLRIGARCLLAVLLVVNVGEPMDGIAWTLTMRNEPTKLTENGVAGGKRITHGILANERDIKSEE